MEWWWRKLTVLTENDYTLTLFAEPTSPNDEAMIVKKMSLLFWPPKLLKPYCCLFTSSIPSVANKTDFFSLDQITILYWEMGESESEVAQLCPTLCDPMDCSLPGSSVHGIFQARVLEWVAISSSRRAFQPRDWNRVSCIVGRRRSFNHSNLLISLY